MFSATWPREVRALAAAFQKDPIHLNVGSLELAANHNIEQHIEVIEEYTKNNKLFELLNGILEKDVCT
jgi:superfamily II DNA/RNA helicase